jgi:hypothetical protein
VFPVADVVACVGLVGEEEEEEVVVVVVVMVMVGEGRRWDGMG